MVLGLALAMLPVTISASELTIDEQTKYQIQEAQTELSNTLTNRAIAQRGKWYGACVRGARQFIYGSPEVGRNQIPSRAKDTVVNSLQPTIGSVIKLNMSIYGHVGVVISFTDDKITYYDTNGAWTGRGAIRVIKNTDPRILGFREIK